MHTFVQKIRSTVETYGLFQKGEPVLLGVSGGPDSMALLHALLALRQEWGIKLHIAHVDHGLRANSKYDAQFVRKEAVSKHVPFYTTTLNLKSTTKGSVEELARQARLRFLTLTARHKGIKTIALGHTQNDLAETVLMRILRGTGLHGLTSILPKRTLYGKTFVRPLIHATREDVLQYLKDIHAPFRTDPSNRSERFFRNRIRHKLLPTLNNYNPNIKSLLANLAYSAGVDYDFLSRQADKFLRSRHTVYHRNMIQLKLPAFTKLHPSIQRVTLQQAVERLDPGPIALTAKHIAATERMLARQVKKAVIKLPSNKLRVSLSSGALTISRQNRD